MLHLTRIVKTKWHPTICACIGLVVIYVCIYALIRLQTGSKWSLRLLTFACLFHKGICTWFNKYEPLLHLFFWRYMYKWCVDTGCAGLLICYISCPSVVSLILQKSPFYLLFFAPNSCSFIFPNTLCPMCLLTCSGARTHTTRAPSLTYTHKRNTSSVIGSVWCCINFLLGHTDARTCTSKHMHTSKHTHCEQMPSLCAAKELLQTKIRENASIYVPLLFIYSRARAGVKGTANTRS